MVYAEKTFVLGGVPLDTLRAVRRGGEAINSAEYRLLGVRGNRGSKSKGNWNKYYQLLSINLNPLYFTREFVTKI